MPLATTAAAAAVAAAAAAQAATPAGEPLALAAAAAAAAAAGAAMNTADTAVGVLTGDGGSDHCVAGRRSRPQRSSPLRTVGVGRGDVLSMSARFRTALMQAASTHASLPCMHASSNGAMPTRDLY